MLKYSSGNGGIETCYTRSHNHRKQPHQYSNRIHSNMWTKRTHTQTIHTHSNNHAHYTRSNNHQTSATQIQYSCCPIIRIDPVQTFLQGLSFASMANKSNLHVRIRSSMLVSWCHVQPFRFSCHRPRPRASSHISAKLTV